MSTAITASMRINNNLKKIDKAEYGLAPTASTNIDDQTLLEAMHSCLDKIGFTDDAKRVAAEEQDYLDTIPLMRDHFRALAANQRKLGLNKVPPTPPLAFPAQQMPPKPPRNRPHTQIGAPPRGYDGHCDCCGMAVAATAFSEHRRSQCVKVPCTKVGCAEANSHCTARHDIVAARNFSP